MGFLVLSALYLALFSLVGSIPFRHLLVAAAFVAVGVATLIRASPYLEHKLRISFLNGPLMQVVRMLGGEQSVAETPRLPIPAKQPTVPLPLAQWFWLAGAASWGTVCIFLFRLGLRTAYRNDNLFLQWVGKGAITLLIIRWFIPVLFLLAFGGEQFPVPFLSGNGTVLFGELSAWGLALQVSRRDASGQEMWKGVHHG